MEIPLELGGICRENDTVRGGEDLGRNQEDTVKPDGSVTRDMHTAETEAEAAGPETQRAVSAGSALELASRVCLPTALLLLQVAISSDGSWTPDAEASCCHLVGWDGGTPPMPGGRGGNEWPWVLSSSVYLED